MKHGGGCITASGTFSPIFIDDGTYGGESKMNSKVYRRFMYDNLQSGILDCNRLVMSVARVLGAVIASE